MTDLRFALRQLLKNPGFTAVAVVSLALGIGANTSIFSLVNAVLLRSLPLPNPHELRVLKWDGGEPRFGKYAGSWNSKPAGRAQGNAFSHAVFSGLRSDAAGQADVFGYLPLQDATVRGSHAPWVSQGAMVSDNYFSGLGVGPATGRLFSAEDEAAAMPVAVISHALWERDFDRDPAVTERTLTVNGSSFTVVGVLPAGFPSVTPANPLDFYVPLSARAVLAPNLSGTAPGHWWLQLMARLKPGVSEAQFRSAAEVVFAREASAFMKSPGMVLEDGSVGPSSDRWEYRRPLLMLLTVVGIVLLVACANLAGLMLARAAARRHELAVCAALGASRWRLMVPALCESLILAASGGVLGVLIALWGRTAISRLLAGNMEGLHYDTVLDARVLGFTAATVILTALLSGILPALGSTRVAPVSSLAGRSQSAGPRQRAGKLLVAAQIALSTVLLVGAALYARTLVNLARIEAGFDTEGLVLFRLAPGAAGYDDARRVRFYDQIQQALAALPGVRSATLTRFKLLAGAAAKDGFTLPGLPPDRPLNPEAHRLTVSETFFDTMQIPIMVGRGFRTGDTFDTAKAVVVNRAFAAKYFPGGNALGVPLRMGGADWEIVGVCGDAKYNDLRAEPPPTIYSSFRQVPAHSTYVALRTSLPVQAILKTVRDAVMAVDSNIPIADVTTQAQVRDGALSQERMFAVLCGALAGLAVLLACIGIYGLMVFDVSRRRGEIGIRMALGAQKRDVLGLILHGGLRLTLPGVGAGLAGALALTRFLSSQLYSVKATDPMTFIGVAFALTGVALVACWLPARRASRVDPMVALRSE